MRLRRIGDVAVLPKICKIGSLQDVKRLRLLVSSVQVGRTEKGTKDYEEWYSIGLYLLRLGTEGLLTYPFKIEKGQSPDFMLTWQSDETTGLEITRTPDKQFQEKMTKAEREFKDREAKAAASGPGATPVDFSADDGLMEGQAEEKFVSDVCKIVEEKLHKLPKYRQAGRHELLIYNDSGGLLSERDKALTRLDGEIRRINAKTTPSFSVISVIMSLDLAFDLGGEFRSLCNRGE